MSEGWGGDAIPSRPSGRAKLVEALSLAQHLPYDALEEALARPQLVADAVLAVAEQAASGAELSERDRNLLVWGVHVLGQARDTRLCGPLLAVLRRPGEAVVDIFEDLVVTTLPNVAIGVFDGDAAALEDLLADREADEAVRWGLFSAYAFLAAAGSIDRGRARQFLIRFDDGRLARAGDLAWTGWREAIAMLGLQDLAGRVDAALADARVMSDEEMDARDAALMARALAEPDDLGRFEENGLGYLDDALADLQDALGAGEETAPEEPVHNPLRHVGRNDPCPCGSGRKFKKCCLDREAA